jgi:hypothetical protein
VARMAQKHVPKAWIRNDNNRSKIPKIVAQIFVLSPMHLVNLNENF